jgi:hypothetical protein
VKNRKSKIIATLAAIFLFLTLVPTFSSAADSVTDEMFKASPEPGLGYMGYSAYPQGSSLVKSSGLVGMKTTAENKVTAISYCSSLEDLSCANSDYFQYRAEFPVCTSPTQVDCIESLSAEDASGKSLTVTNKGIFSEEKNHTYVGSKTILLPSGGVTSLFEIPEASHGGGTLYLPMVTSDGYWDKSLNSLSTIGNTGIFLYAVKIEKGQYQVDEISTDPTRYNTKNWVAGTTDERRCVHNDSTTCAVAYPLPTNIKFGLKVRYGSNLKGWFHGRIQDPSISYESNAGGGKTITASAFAIKIPSLSIWKKKSELTPELTAFYAKQDKPLGGSGSGAGNLALQNGSPDNWSLMLFNNTGYGQGQMEEFLTWLPTFGDKATFLPTVWNLNLMTEQFSTTNKQNCYKETDSLTGIVSTNATQYLSGPPTYNSATEELEYKVAGPHFLPNGDLFRGTYDLTLRSDFARCLYGITGTAFKAIISIISESGVSINAVTTIGEKNGWMYLSAKGFTFSNPTLRVKLVQDAPTPVVTPTPTPTPTATIKPVSIQKMIVCVKGKTTKKVKAISPKCPSGYKKK